MNDRTRAVASPGVLLDDLARLAGLVEPDQEDDVADLVARLCDNRFRILVVGEAKRGKSSLINALLGRQVLPVGVVPVTSVTTTVSHGTFERLIVDYRDGRRAEAGLAELAGLVDERANPGNRLGVDQVSVYVDAQIVRDGIELVDTPGTGSVYDHGREAERALRTMDAAILVLTADPPLSASERDLLAEVAATAVHTFVVVNKADQLEPADVATVVEFVADQTTALLGGAPEVLVCSAREALRARAAGTVELSAGISELEAALAQYLASEREAGLLESVRRKAARLISATLDGLNIRLSLAAFRADEAHRRSEDFLARLERVRRRRAEAADLVAVGTTRMLADLNAAAAETEVWLDARAVSAVRSWVDGPGAGLRPAAIRVDGRTYAVEWVRTTVDRWRLGRSQALTEGLRRLDDRLLADLSADLADIAVAAREVLGVELGAESDRSALVDNPDFSYQFGDQIGWSELLTDSLRRRLGGRRHALEELLAETERLARQQVGRVRSDLQARLQESGRSLVGAVAERFASATDLLEHALADAVQDRETSAADASDVATVLRPRIVELHHLRARLRRARH